MAIANTVLLALLLTALILSIIELGLSADVVSIWRQTFDSVDEIDGYTYTYHVNLPGPVAFLLFCSIWSLLVTAALIALPLRFRRNRSTLSTPAWLVPLTLALNAVTMIFWLAGFAALANLYNGFETSGIAAALLAFAVLAWLVFLAILVLNILTALGVVASDTPGYTPISRTGGQKSGPTSVPMSHV